MAFSNPSNKIATGQCCQTGLPVSHSCSLNCHTRFEVCLDDLHLKGPTCTFGKNSSQVFPTSNLRVNGTSLERSITISTSLSWPVSTVYVLYTNIDLCDCSVISQYGAIIRQGILCLQSFLLAGGSGFVQDPKGFTSRCGKISCLVLDNPRSICLQGEFHGIGICDTILI